jgi:transposase InsO family protein
MKHASRLIKMKIFFFIQQCSDTCLTKRFKKAAEVVYEDDETKDRYKYTANSIATWYYQFKKKGVESFLQKTRKDKGKYRKISPQHLAECLSIALEHLPKTTSMRAIKMVAYRWLLDNNYFTRSQMAITTFYRVIKEKELLKPESCEKLRLEYAHPFANDYWQGDTLHGPLVADMKGQQKKTYLIALIDDASRLITHASFYHAETIYELVHALKMAIYCRGKPTSLYFDNGSIYKAKTIIDACVRLNIVLSHTPVRDGSAKGKIERFFNTVRSNFFKAQGSFKNIDHLNELFKEWVQGYNNRIHSSIQMTPENRFSLDINRVKYLENNDHNDEIFFLEATRNVTKTNTFSLHNVIFECPADMREKVIEVRFEAINKQKVVVYYKEKRIGPAHIVNLHLNATLKREYKNNKNHFPKDKK